MATRALILVGMGAIGAGALLAYVFYRRRSTPGLDWLDVSDFGLELMSGCCAFVVFTTPSCRPCRSTVRIIEGVVGGDGATELTTVNAIERADLATRYRVKTVPTTFLITASGHVLARWSDVPPKGEVEKALQAV